MFKIKKNINLEYLIIIFILILIIFYFIYKNYLQIESFGGSNDGSAFLTPKTTKWYFKDSSDWYKVKQGGFSIKLSETGMNVDNPNISILFLYNNFQSQPYWRNIFHFTNGNHDCCNKGDRIPAMWICPRGWPTGGDHSFHIPISTDENTNDYGKLMLPNASLPFGKPMFIGVVVNGLSNTVSLYIDNILQSTGKYKNIHKRNANTILYIGDPWYQQDGNVYIKNFTIYDAALKQSEINDIYTLLDQGMYGKNGEDGPQGPKGSAGRNGQDGQSGEPGMNGDQGPDGILGIVGPIGPAGPEGSTSHPTTKDVVAYKI
jgi:hypothetical protein